VTITLVGLALIASLGVSLGISVFEYDSLNVPQGLGPAVSAVGVVLLAVFLILVVRQIRARARDH
jgi:hypothetical protein